MNKVILIGRLTKDIEVRSTSNGIQTCQFTIAVNRAYKNKEGNYDADFINCVAYRNTAEYLGKYFKKGNQICVEGSIQTRTYDDKDNKKVYVTEIIVDNVMLLERKQNNQQEETDLKEIGVPDNYTTQYEEAESVKLSDKDLPF